MTFQSACNLLCLSLLFIIFMCFVLLLQYAALNAQSQREQCCEDDEVPSLFQWADISTDPQFVIGNEVQPL